MNLSRSIQGTSLFPISPSGTESRRPNSRTRPKARTQQRTAEVEAIFARWNSYASQSIEKNGEQVAWKSHKAISPEIRNGAAARLEDYAVDQICAAIDNYAAVLLDPECFWSYPWALYEFLTRKQGRDKGAPLQLLQFLPDNFIPEKYVAKRFARDRAEPSIAEQAGCGPADMDSAIAAYQEAGLTEG